MTEETKLRYELKRRSENYVGLCEGDHCLAAICTKRTRGVLDAQLLLLVMNSHKDLLAACEWINAFISTASDGGDAWCAIRNQPGAKEWAKNLEAVINNAKPKAEKEVAK